MTAPRYFVSLDLRRADFSGQQLDDVDFSYSDLRGARFQGASLRRACFAYADLRGVDLSEADTGEADFGQARLSGIRFAAPIEDEQQPVRPNGRRRRRRNRDRSPRLPGQVFSRPRWPVRIGRARQ